MNPTEYLYFLAKLQPDAVAVQWVGGEWRYGQLLALVRAAAGRLRAAGVGPGAHVVTCLPDRAVDWLVTLAAMHEAAVTASTQCYAPVPAALRADFVVTDLELAPDVVGTARVVCIDPSWLQLGSAAPDPGAPKPYPGDDALLRLIMTSGTTGTPRIVANTLAQRLGRSVEPSASARRRKTLGLMGLACSGGLHCAMQALLEGQVLYHARSADEALELLVRHDIELLYGAPRQLAELVEALRRRPLRPTALREISYAGCSASPKLVDELRAALCPHVESVYASSEAGSIARLLTHQPGLPDGAAGYLLPGVQLEIVDDADLPLPLGSVGHVRVRAPYMAQGYFGDDAARAFRGGWFHPGDLGSLRGDGLLVLHGRRDEVVNRGGIKFDPGQIDRVADAAPGVLDAAAFAFENARGAEDLALALVLDARFDFDALQRQLQQAVAAPLLPSCYLRVPSIPRNAMGKAQRAQLRRLYTEAARGASGA